MKADVLITGVAGFIGSHLCLRLIADGFSVIGIDDFSHGKATWLESLNGNPDFRLLTGDAGDSALLNAIEAETAVHLASQKIPRYSSGYETLVENYRVNQAIVNFCIQKQTRLLYASSSDVYGKNPIVPYTEESDLIPGSPAIKRWAYAASKLHGEHLIQAAGRECGLLFQIMRFFGCYGPHQAEGWWGGPQSVFIEKALVGEPMSIHGDGNQTRSFIYIDDLVEGIATLVRQRELPSDTFNLCSSPESEISIRELAAQIWTAIRPKENMKLEFVPYSDFGSYEDVLRRTGLAIKARQAFGFATKTSLAEGLRKTIAWRLSLAK